MSLMEEYDSIALDNVEEWRQVMHSPPTFFDTAAKTTQERINRAIPERIHQVVTTAVKQMTRAVIFGAELTSTEKHEVRSLEKTEAIVRNRINFYSSTAAAEGAITGYGGFLMALTDLPLWMSVKIKMMFDIAGLYGHDINDYKERLFILHVFQLTFSRQRKRNEIIKIIDQWEKEKKQLPDTIHQFDWRTFQLNYRDYLDLAKILQLIPGFGAIAGFYINRRLTKKLGENAINAYRLRRFKKGKWL